MSSNIQSLGLGLKQIESSRYFQGFVILVIIISALAIGAKTYELPPVAEQMLTVLDYGITVFFLVEILIRFLAHQDKRRFFHDGWNVFDFIVVMGSIIPLENADAVLLGRLLRVFRVLRLVSVIPELRSLINALIKAIPRMGYIALLMFVIFYIYGASGSLFFAEINPTLWGDVSISMLTLFRVATFEDWTDVMYETMVTYPFSWLYYLSFIFLTAFIFLNMMVGTILEVMTAEHNADVEAEAADDRAQLLEKVDQLSTQVEKLQHSMEEVCTRLPRGPTA